MSKMISANKLNRFWKNGVLAKMIGKERVLKTVEEVEASTNEENLVSAVVVSELINDLGHGRVQIVVNEDNTLGYRLDGADAVPFFNYKHLLKDGKVTDNQLIIDMSLSNLAYSSTYGGLVLQKTTGTDYYGNADGDATLQINVTNMKKIYVNAISRSTYFYTTLDGVRHCGNVIDVSSLTGIHTFVIHCGNQSNVGVGLTSASLGGSYGPDDWNSNGIYDVYYK